MTGGTLAFTSARREHDGQPVTFTLDGVTYSCTRELAGMALLDLGAAADVDLESLAGVRAVQQFLRCALADEKEWHRFHEHTLRERTDARTLLEIVKQVIPALTGRPTESPSASAPGPSATSATSRVVSFARGTVEETSSDSAAAS